jgi:NADH:ubiquinone oxidoreductase subunit E
MGMGQTSCNGTPLDEATLLGELDSVIEEYRLVPGGLIPVLQITQTLFGYLPEPALKKICLGFDKSYSEVAGVVSFYSFFSTVPRGKYTVRVCLGTACYVRGGKEVLAAIRKELGIEVGQTTADRLFTLEVGRCFGACGLAPVVMIQDTVHQRVKPSKIGELLAGYRAAAEQEVGA